MILFWCDTYSISSYAFAADSQHITNIYAMYMIMLMGLKFVRYAVLQLSPGKLV